MTNDNYLNNEKNQAVKGLSITRYPSGEAEVITWTPFEFAHNKEGKQREAKEKSEMSENSKIAANCRAKKMVRQKIISMQADRMLTLTYRDAMTDFDILWKDFSKLIRQLKKAKEDFPYVAVPELHKSGGIHLHIAIKGFIDIRMVRSYWYHITGGREDGKTGGQTHISGSKFKDRKSPMAIASYVGKYMTKAMDIVSISRNRYRVSLGIKIDKTVKYLSPFMGRELQSHLFMVLEDHIGRTLASCFEYKENQFWFATWAKKKRYVTPEGEIVWC